MMPSKKEISATIGSALTPTCSQVYQTSFQRTRCGCVIANHSAALGFADEGDLHAHVAADDQRGAANLGHRVQPLFVFFGRGAQRSRIELVEQGLELGLQT